mgnify:CR=1 FL=1
MKHHRSLVAAGLLCGGLILVSGKARADWSSTSSTISEVDACNQAQYLMPEKAVVQEFRLRQRDSKEGTSFECKVRWSEKASAKPTDRPILFPSRIRQPLFAAGWL